MLLFPVSPESTQLALDKLLERLAETARQHFGGDLRGKLVLAAGLAGAGAVQPFAATRQGAAFLGIEPDPDQIKRALKAGYCEIMVNSLDEALRILKNAVRRHEPASVGLIGDFAAAVNELAARGVVPDIILGSSAGMEKLPGVAQLQRLGSVFLEMESAAPSE